MNEHVANLETQVSNAFTKEFWPWNTCTLVTWDNEGVFATNLLDKGSLEDFVVVRTHDLVCVRTKGIFAIVRTHDIVCVHTSGFFAMVRTHNSVCIRTTQCAYAQWGFYAKITWALATWEIEGVGAHNAPGSLILAQNHSKSTQTSSKQAHKYQSIKATRII